MTVKMTRKKLLNSFDMPSLRLKAKRLMRKRYKKTISKREVDRIWKNYCEYGIIQPLLKYGNVQIGNDFGMEIVGKRIENSKLFGLFSKGLAIKGGMVVEQMNISSDRMGIVYGIKITDSSYKHGKLVFEADKNLKKRVHNSVKSIVNNYRIEK